MTDPVIHDTTVWPEQYQGSLSPTPYVMHSVDNCPWFLSAFHEQEHLSWHPEKSLQFILANKMNVSRNGHDEFTNLLSSTFFPDFTCFNASKPPSLPPTSLIISRPCFTPWGPERVKGREKEQINHWPLDRALSARVSLYPSLFSSSKSMYLYFCHELWNTNRRVVF